MKREYVAALEKEMVARGNQAVVQRLLNEGRNEASVQWSRYTFNVVLTVFIQLINLTEKEQQLHSAKAELTALYGRVFDGPSECTLNKLNHHSDPCAFYTATVAFPEDDRLEYDLHAAEKRHDQIQAALNSDSRAAEILARAVRYMDVCQSSMQEALGYSRYGPFLSPYTAIAD